ncbi:TMEM175 family protein [Arthrobacter sp. ATA002]|uniref:TMEM175 family protein n=1 Tax=Arthrobacter sp. ATA002 TaxID=2991715 RepID=UPI0022A78F9A|nr:TMEM175 family protein [Arthrobacter sp. ATA002]WAP52219.1 TMEM175 family protein [Arthrobacter sp. ATA002]
MAEQPAESGAVHAGAGRLISFADAVVAIAMTLLILPLVTDAAGIGGQSPGAFLRANTFSLFAFVLSFVVVFRFWLAHHRMYEKVTGYTPALAWAVLAWLLSLVFLPFPTQLLESGGALTTGLYIGTMLLTSTSALVQQLIISRTPALRAPGTGPAPVLPAATMTAVMAAALAAALVFPRVGLWALLLLFLQPSVERLAARILRAA